jgi:hypothetical protein
MRVQIPAYTDRWMMGDRYGEVIKITKKIRKAVVGGTYENEIAHVKLDKSGKTMRFVFDDCTVVS